MRKFIRSFSPVTEFFVVIGICFGYFIFVSITWALSPHGGSLTTPAIEFTNAELIHILVLETVLATAAALLLWVRGWQVADFNIRPSWIGCGAGLLLVGIDDSVYKVLYRIYFETTSYTASAAEAISEVLPSDELSLILVLAVSILNPFFEEIFVVGYVIKAMDKLDNAFLAIGISTVIRTLYHLYQGPFAYISILPLGILFGYVYWRWRNLWPLIFAHGLLDYFGFEPQLAP